MNFTPVTGHLDVTMQDKIPISDRITEKPLKSNTKDHVVFLTHTFTNLTRYK